MKEKILQFLNVEHKERGRVALLLIMSFFMGIFVATYSVASQSLFLEHFDEKTQLPIALLYSGAFGLLATIIYNFLQNRIPFPVLAGFSIMVIAGITAFIEFGGHTLKDPNQIFFMGFTSFIPFSFIVLLVFWGAFGRLFNLRQAKRLLGTVDLGAMIASFLAFFIIPQLFTLIPGFRPETLYTVSLMSIISFLALLIFMGIRYLSTARSFAQEKLMYNKVGFSDFINNRYLRYMSLFVIVSMIAMNFVDYSFLNVTTLYNQGAEDKDAITKFISYFEMTIVIFSFLFDQVATDRIIKEYGMRVSLLINPILIGLFTVTAFALGSVFGYTKETSFFTIFFIIIAVSKLFLRSLKETIDDASFKLHLLPIESNIRIDVQTKITGTVTAFASLIAGGLIYLITNVEAFGLLSITMFTIPLLVGWYLVTNRMHHSYRDTLQSALSKGKDKTKLKRVKEYSVSMLLEKEVNSNAEDKAIYALMLMEKLEPALFESCILRLAGSESRKIKAFAEEKIKTLGITGDPTRNEIRSLAESAASATDDSDLLSIPVEKLIKLSKSGKQGDRVLAAKLLRKLISPKTIFVLLELLRDVDPKVRMEALYTARKVNRPETWPVLIELLGSPTYSHLAASALKEVGEKVLPTLETAFHKSGQSEIVMLRIVQIMGRIGGPKALQLLWKKADYPDKRIVKQILYSLRYINYQATGREIREVYSLLETEMSKAIWNLAALDELPDEPRFKFLKEALTEEVHDNYDQIFMLLAIVYEPQSVQLVRDNLDSGDADSIAFAMELLDLFVDAELKPKLLPLLDDSSTKDKLKHLQIYYPRESYNPIQVINYILNRDYNFNNRWTKVCAIHASAFIDDFRVSRGLVAQMFNSDKLLQETAAWVIFNKDKNLYERISERLPARDKRFLDSSIENNQLLNGLDDGFFLFIEMVMFIKQSPAFRNISGLLVSDLADKIMPLDLEFGERVKLNAEEHNAPLLIVAHGEVKLLSENNIISTLKTGDVFGELFNKGTSGKLTALEASQRSVVFRINLMDFYFVLANHHELVQGLIKNITEDEVRAEA
jgi:ATP:ADP antiporter, AAA family